jgi:hypothetical protein
MTDAKRSFATRRRKSLTSSIFSSVEVQVVETITTGTSRGNVCASDMQTGKGQRTVWTNRRDETGRRPELP